MLKNFFKIILSLIVLSSCSTMISTEKVYDFNLADYESFSVEMSQSSEEVRVSPFTIANLNKEFEEEVQNLGLVLDNEKGAIKFKVSISLDEDNRGGVYGYRSRAYGRWGGPIWYEDYDDYDRAFLRVTILDTEGLPLWTGFRPVRYFDRELRLDEEEVSSLVKSFLVQLTQY